MALKGLNEALANINRQIDGIQGRTQAGLWAAGLTVQRTSMQRAPIEYGVLRASAYTRKAGTGQGRDALGRFTGNGSATIGADGLSPIEVGFNAAYAVYVHENMEQKLKGQPRPSGKGVYWGPQGRPKFLESALTDEADNIIKQVAARAKVTGAA